MKLQSGKFSPRGSTQLVLDAALVAGLGVALLVVMGIDRLLTPEQQPAAVVVEDAPAEKPSTARKLRLGVTPETPEYDDMGSLLNSLGEGYRHIAFSLDDLLDETKVSQYDIIFLTCSGYTSTWLNTRTGNSARGTETYTPNEQTFAKAKQVLRQFVGAGGTLYASDLHFNLIAECFPELIDLENVDAGRKQLVAAEVVDPGLRELIGSSLQLTFDQPGWRPASFKAEQSTCYLRGEFESISGQTRSAPLLVKFPYQEGNVIFTSFHNEKQHSETEAKLLRYLVFAAVTANVDSQVGKMLVRGGFAPAKKNLFNTSPGEQSVEQTYHCAKVADLQFVLGFADQGARLKLSVTSPEGKQWQREETSTVTIDIPQAATGDWKYRVTALQVPNENFPFTVTVGAK